MNKNILLVTSKILIAAGLLYWLFSSGKLDFSLIIKSLNYPLSWVVGLSCVILNIIIGAYRWKILVHTIHDITFFKSLRLTWIGLLFNSVLPGAVSGDFIKVVYAKKEIPKLSKTFLLVSVMIDRVLGLIGLLILLGLGTILLGTSNSLIESSGLIYFNFILFIGALVFIVSLFLPVKIQSIFLVIGKKVPILGDHIHKTLAAIWDIGRNKKIILSGILISIIGQASNISAFYFLIKPFVTSELTLGMCFSFVPIGLICVAIPITPAGLGLGHAVFDKLFSLFGIKGGASFFNFYFLATLTANCLGLIPYLATPKQTSVAKPISQPNELQ